jgi:anti-sigma-K factor RskA
MNADVHALAGAYALDALPPEETTAFTDHLAECSACRQEVAELQATAAQLGMAAAQAPPPGMRDRVLRAAHETRQVPPTPAPTPAPTDLADRRRRSRQRASVAAAAVAALVLGGLGLQQVLDDEATDPITAVMTAPDAHATTAPMRGGGRLTVVSSQELDQAVVHSDRLPALRRSRVYQLWLVDPDGAARSADVLIRPGTSAGQSHLVRGLRPGDAIAITSEPAGGSEQPTTTPLAVADSV